MKLDPFHIIWQRALLDGLSVGGTWGIPQSGAIIKKIARNKVHIDHFGNDARLIRVVVQYIEAAGYIVVNPAAKAVRDHNGNGKKR